MASQTMVNLWLEDMYDQAIADAKETIEIEKTELAQTSNPTFKECIQHTLDNLYAYIEKIENLKEALNGN